MGKFGARDVDIVAVVLVRRRVLQSPVGGGGGGRSYYDNMATAFTLYVFTRGSSIWG